MRKKILSIVGYVFSIVGVLGVILSSAIAEVFLFVIAAMSGLFTLGVMGQHEGH